MVFRQVAMLDAFRAPGLTRSPAAPVPFAICLYGLVWAGFLYLRAGRFHPADGHKKGSWRSPLRVPDKTSARKGKITGFYPEH
jgi:hypothetical protein